MIHTSEWRANHPQFRRRWRGYDRAEVDEFLQRTAADRQRIQEDLAQLEVIMRRRAATSAEPAPVPAAIAMHAAPSRAQTWPALVAGGRQYLLIGALAAVAFVLVVFGHYRPKANTNAVAAAAPSLVASQSVSKAVAPTAPVGQPAADPAGDLMLTLIARGPCWVRTTVDGKPPSEQLLRANETIVVRAKDEAVLRVGDAAALSLLINHQAAKPLGAPGQVITTRITRKNYVEFLAGN